MTESSKINIKKLIVHILDNNTQVPVLSDMEHPVDDEVYEYIQNHIVKILNDDGIKAARFTDESSGIFVVCKNILENEIGFHEATKQIAETLYELMNKNPDIPSADVVFCLFDLDEIPHLGILKFNYRPSYIHYVGNKSEGRVNSIIKQKTALPGEAQKVEECALINLEDFSIKLIEKKYEINGEKLYYFSSMLLSCDSEISDRDKAKLLKKATQSFSKKYYGEDFTKAADIRSAISESIEQNDTIDIVSVADNVFKRNPDMKSAYIEHVEKSGLKDSSITINEKVAEKVFKKHKIKTDTGIEINLPFNFYRDKDKIEFVSNPDGTISIVLKNIGSIIDCS